MITTREIHQNYYKKLRKEPLVLVRDYRKIVNAINKKIKERVLFGESVRLPRLGTLTITKKERNFNKPRLDMGSTMKLKKKLLAEGKTVYKEWKDEDGNKQNNGGEKYFVYYTDDIFYMFNIGNNRCLKNDKGENWWFYPTSTLQESLAKRLKQ